MPELPEVETIARGLNRKLRNRKITALWTDWPKYFKLPKSKAAFNKHVAGKKITGVSRRGKNVLIHLSDNHLLLVHQKMSGHLMVGKWKMENRKWADTVNNKWEGEIWIPTAPESSPLWDPMNRFIRLIFFLDNKEMFALSDLRRFAKVLCGSKETILNLPDLKGLGPEPLDKNFTFGRFRELFGGKRGRIKQVLMDQNFISGIGNIYADEILWFSKIHPATRVESLKEEDLRKVYSSMKKVLKKALQLRGTSIDDYRDSAGRRGTYDLVRHVYQREGEPCKRCGVKIRRLKLGGRSAHYCPKCKKS
ncbi:MAG: bifunctional DNA-formamidopyrimidine glycosylase/DNA-(apurinic or apyrimidinic site) lyase [Candidatus Brennerbacteria bacterium]|nr:bifunctional DNA-formamidopyrimidine glycosylase/DNA-(apurinic or apyrimidinic site) lyase [Candidatus Brennerbacteria bacterium]